MLTLVSEAPEVKDDDILVIGCLRNEMLRLSWFLTHYRNLGVDRFLLIDNDSDDGSCEFLRSQPDVTLFHTTQSYAESGCGIGWQNAILDSYAVGHWSFVVDVDELFIFPGYEQTGIRSFAAYVEKAGANAVMAPMLDMYSDRPIAQTDYCAGENMLEICPFFDAEGYVLGGSNAPTHGLPIRGGPRHRMFWEKFKRDYPSPVLKKVPLLLWSGNAKLEASTHHVRGAVTASVSGLLLHFKFLQDFAENARHETERAEHFAGARQYRAYDEVLASDSGLTAYHEGSVRFRDSAQLCRLGLMKMPADYPFLQVDMR